MADRQNALSAARFGDGAHVFPIRVYYEDTDAGGIVYHSNYLKFAERARTEMIRTFGGDHSRLREDMGIAFVVSRCEADFKRPAILDDLVEVRTVPNDVGAARLDLAQNIWRGDEELVRLRVVVGCIAANGRPTRMPAPIRARLDSWKRSGTQEG